MELHLEAAINDLKELCLKKFSLNSQELLAFQPNRRPFLMIDHVTEVIPGVSAEGYKNLPEDEWYFPIHFPNNPKVKE